MSNLSNAQGLGFRSVWKLLISEIIHLFWQGVQKIFYNLWSDFSSSNCCLYVYIYIFLTLFTGVYQLCYIPNLLHTLIEDHHVQVTSQSLSQYMTNTREGPSKLFPMQFSKALCVDMEKDHDKCLSFQSFGVLCFQANVQFCTHDDSSIQINKMMAKSLLWISKVSGTVKDCGHLIEESTQ